MQKGKYTENVVRDVLKSIMQVQNGFPPIRLFDTFSARGNRLPDRPCDFIVILPKGKAILLEVKETKHERGLLFSAIRPAQMTAMQIAHSMDLPYYLIVKAYKLKRWFVIPAAKIIDAKIKVEAYKLLTNEKPTKKMITSYISWDSLNEFSMAYKDLYNYLFDLFQSILNNN